MFPKALLRAAVCAGLLLAVSPAAAQQNRYVLTIPQTRAAARAAIEQGDYMTAIRLAKALLQADARDSQAYYLIAHSYAKLGDARLGRKAAGYAFRYAKHDRDRYITSQLAARMAVQDKRYTLAQYWQRRSFDYVPDERLRRQAIADFKRLRAENPWTMQLRFSVNPSNNVNSGAKDSENDIDELDTEPLDLTASALALSGMTINGKILASYRLARSENAETRFQFSASTRQVILSTAAKQKLSSSPFPSERGLTGSDFSSIRARIGLSHNFRLGVSPDTPKGNGFGRVGVSYGESWYGGERYFRSYKASAARTFRLNTAQSLQLSAELDHRDYSRPDRTSLTGELRLTYSAKLANSAQVSAGLVLARTNSSYGNFRKQQASGYVMYQPAAKLGPARATFSIGTSIAEYPTYRLLTGPFTLTTLQRNDQSIFGAASLHFEDYDFAGFSPVVTLHARETESNIGRFDTGEMKMSIGFRSNF